MVQCFWARSNLPTWDALEAQFRKGPPPFLRPGWKSPMLGKKVDLRWLDTGSFEHIRGSMAGWRDAKVLLIEFWASYVYPNGSLSRHTPHTWRARLEACAALRY